MTLRVLNVGGGNKAIPIPAYYDGWEHLLLDIDPKGQPDVCADARDLTDLPPDQFDAIYCSHNLEHFYAHDVKRVLAGFRHVLRPNGFAEIRVPDIGALMKIAVERQLDINATLYEATGGIVSVHDIIYGFGHEIEHSGHDYFAHKTGFTPASLGHALSLAGFRTALLLGTDVFLEIAVVAFKSAPTPSQKRRFITPS